MNHFLVVSHLYPQTPCAVCNDQAEVSRCDASATPNRNAGTAPPGRLLAMLVAALLAFHARLDSAPAAGRRRGRHRANAANYPGAWRRQRPGRTAAAARSRCRGTLPKPHRAACGVRPAYRCRRRNVSNTSHDHGDLS